MEIFKPIRNQPNKTASNRALVTETGQTNKTVCRPPVNETTRPQTKQSQSSRTFHYTSKKYIRLFLRKLNSLPPTSAPSPIQTAQIRNKFDAPLTDDSNLVSTVLVSKLTLQLLGVNLVPIDFLIPDTSSKSPEHRSESFCFGLGAKLYQLRRFSHKIYTNFYAPTQKRKTINRGVPVKVQVKTKISIENQRQRRRRTDTNQDKKNMEVVSDQFSFVYRSATLYLFRALRVQLQLQLFISASVGTRRLR